MNQHMSRSKAFAARASLRVSAAQSRMDRLNARFVEDTAKLRRRLAQDRREVLSDDNGLESIEVVVLSVVGLGIAVALGAAIRALVERFMAQLG